MKPEEAIRIFGILARAVAAVHDAGMVHRDIKPENIFIVEDDGLPIPMLLDFGIARDVDAPTSTTTENGLIRGTPAYMAPERFFGSPASVASDVYELGVTLYMMLVGKLPWGSNADVSDRLAPRSPSHFAPIPSALGRAVLGALSTRPEVRPASASALAEQVEAAWASGSAGADARSTAALEPQPPSKVLSLATTEAALQVRAPLVSDGSPIERNPVDDLAEVGQPNNPRLRSVAVVAMVAVAAGALWMGFRREPSPLTGSIDDIAGSANRRAIEDEDRRSASAGIIAGGRDSYPVRSRRPLHYEAPMLLP